jgi:Skp family chaperone for outer membrane proteins
MKKIFTLLLSLIIVTSSFAQVNYNVHGAKNTNTNYYASSNDRDHYRTQSNSRIYRNIVEQRDREIQNVNDLNNYKVQTIANDCNLNIWEKRDVLDWLETQRIREVNIVYARYNDEVASARQNQAKRFLAP